MRPKGPASPDCRETARGGARGGVARPWMFWAPRTSMDSTPLKLLVGEMIDVKLGFI